MEHITHSKGDIGVARVTSDLLVKGIQVFRPVSAVTPFDLAVLINDKFYRLEVKYRNMKDGYVDATPKIHLGNKGYIRNEAFDVIAIYCADNDTCYYVKRSDFDATIKLRILPAKNNQVKGTRAAKDYLNFPEMVS